MSASTVDRLLLLGDNIRLSLLERKRSANLNLEPDGRIENEISRSLDTLLQGIEQLEKDQTRMEEHGTA